MNKVTHLVNEITIDELVKRLINDIESSTQTIEEYCLIAALGSVAKQLEAFNKYLHVADSINQYLDGKGFPHKECGSKISIES